MTTPLKALKPERRDLETSYYSIPHNGPFFLLTPNTVRFASLRSTLLQTSLYRSHIACGMGGCVLQALRIRQTKKGKTYTEIR